MPTFPTYRGELPKCLNPLNLRHYFLLAYWVYFRPTALKCYLYQADPDLYRAGAGLGIFRTWRVPAYRNLYLMMPYAIALLSILVGLPVVLAISKIQSTPLDWLGWARGVAVGVVIGTTFGTIGSAILGLAGSGAWSMASGVVGGVAFGVAGGVASSVAGSVVFGTVAGTIFRAVFGVVLGMAFGVAFSVISGVAGSTASGIALSIASAMLSSETLKFSVAVSIGALRAVSYPFQFGLALRSTLGGGKHPLEWDELIVLPLPRVRRALAQRLQGNEPDGLRFVADVACNSFQRWAAQSALQSYLHDQTSPLRFLYTLLVSPDMTEYVFAAVTKEGWERLPSIRRLLLGELDRRWVDCSGEWLGRLAERLAWSLTWLFRDRRVTPLTRFAGMLYELLDEKTVEADKFSLAAYAKVYTGLMNYPGGAEIACSFETMAAFLSYNSLSALPAAVGQEAILSRDAPPIRPTVLTALARLGGVGAEIAAYRDATSRVNKLAALARATDALDDLDEYVVAEVMIPEQHILRRIVRQWRRLVSEAGGQAGRAEEIGPVANPYVLNNPVQGNLFIGREDVMRRLEELWGGEGQKPSLVLYGHRRMGKSSILHNLGARFGARTVIVDFNMQRVGQVNSTNELLYNLALALYDSFAPVMQRRLEGEQPAEGSFAAHNPYTAFDRFLKQLDEARAGRRFIITVDEFELIEQGIIEQRLEARLLDFWRGLIQTYPWFIMVFAGLHTLQEMTQDYWNPLFGSVTGIPVSFLSHDAAWQLITNPAPDFPIDYDADAVERIIALTHGQPYLIQLICHGLVTRFNRQMFEENAEFTFPLTFPVSFGREQRFALAEVEAVIATPEFYREGNAYFTGVWVQAERSDPRGQTTVLRALARSEAGMPVEEIARDAHRSLEETQRALETLARHDVVTQENDRWKFTVELMRRWVAQSVKDDGKLDQVRV